MAHLILNVGYDHDLILVRDCLTLFSKVITVLYLSMFGFPQIIFIINTPKRVSTAEGMQHFLTSSIYLAQNWKDFEGNEHNSEKARSGH